MEKTIEELKVEANDLGIKFVKTIGAVKLAAKIDEYYESQSAGDLVKVIDEEEDVNTETKPLKVATKETAEMRFRRESIARRKRASKTRIVTITNTDKREAHLETMVYLSAGDMAGRFPLDIPIELPIALIQIAKTTMISTHVDEVVKGVRTGNKTAKTVRKFVVSYEDMDK